MSGVPPAIWGFRFGVLGLIEGQIDQRLEAGSGADAPGAFEAEKRLWRKSNVSV
jgi:hypothetical protein